MVSVQGTAKIFVHRSKPFDVVVLTKVGKKGVYTGSFRTDDQKFINADGEKNEIGVVVLLVF